MIEEPICRRDTLFARRQILAPGESTPWHVDPYYRFAVVIRGNELAIEYRDSGEEERFPVSPGLAGWDEPTDRVHRGTNVGSDTYEEITLFFLDDPDAVPQPIASED
jgi:hypothetical protein